MARHISLATLGLILAAGCGDKDGKNGDGSKTRGTATGTTGTATGTATGTGTGTGTAAATQLVQLFTAVENDGDPTRLYGHWSDPMVERLTEGGALVPEISPDGAHVVFGGTHPLGEFLTVPLRLDLVTLDDPVPLLAEPSGNMHPKDMAWSHDGTQIAVGHLNSQGFNSLSIAYPDASAPRLLFDVFQEALNLEWRDDDAWLAYTDQSELHVVDIGSGVDRLLGDGGGPIPDWQPGGTLLASRVAGNVLFYDPDGDTVLLDVAGNYPGWSPDGSRRHWWEAGELHLSDPDGSAEVMVNPGAPVSESPVVWASDSSRLATGDWIVDAYGTRTDLVQTITEPAWSPDGSQLAGRGWSNGTVLFVTTDGTDPRVVSTPGTGSDGVHPNFSWVNDDGIFYTVPDSNGDYQLQLATPSLARTVPNRVEEAYRDWTAEVSANNGCYSASRGAPIDNWLTHLPRDYSFSLTLTRNGNDTQCGDLPNCMHCYAFLDPDATEPGSLFCETYGATSGVSDNLGRAATLLFGPDGC